MCRLLTDHLNFAEASPFTLTMAQLGFSVIIPAYNEEIYLPRLLDSIDLARSSYAGGSDQIEVIVADNASTDLTAVVAESRGCRIASVGRRSIAASRNGGAAIAKGEILCFIDADSAIHLDTFNAVNAAMKSYHFVGGSTGIYLERLSLGIALSYLMFLPIPLLFDMDTGLVFCRRDDFQELGGFDQERLYAEDMKFQWMLRKLGRTRGQKLIRLTGVRALGSTRKFDQYGDWHYFGMAFQALIGLLTGRQRDTEIADRYWYKPKR
jgi:glycosyltransferase involved in cell wall biosynthesis